jgi:hypothetical protein
MDFACVCYALSMTRATKTLAASRPGCITHYKVVHGTTILLHLIYVVLALLEPTELVGVQGQHSTLHIYADRSLVAQDPRIMVIKNVLIWTDWWKSGDAGSRLRVSPSTALQRPEPFGSATLLQASCFSILACCQCGHIYMTR